MNESTDDLATLYVLDQLDPADRAAFEERLLRDPELAALVRDLESGLARAVRALPPQEPPAGTLNGIEARIDAVPATTAVPAGRARWVSFARWGLAAMIAVSLTILAVQSLRPAAARPMIIVVNLETNHSTMTELPFRESARDADARFIQLASLAEDLWDKPAAPPIPMTPASGDNRGYALFDPGSRQGFIVIEQLPVTAPDQRYHLWIVDPATAHVHDAGILPLAGTNRGLYSFMLAPGDAPQSDRPNFFVTMEENDPAPSLAQPRGKVVLGRQRI